MSINETHTVEYVCDGPACSETAVTPVDWIVTGVAGDTEGAVGTKFATKHFHEEACMQAHIDV